MNGFEKLLYEAGREIEKCNRELAKAQEAGDQAETLIWARAKMQAHMVENYIKDAINGERI